MGLLIRKLLSKTKRSRRRRRRRRRRKKERKKERKKGVQNTSGVVDLPTRVKGNQEIQKACGLPWV